MDDTLKLLLKAVTKASQMQIPIDNKTVAK
mgnify:CR=1 FL=1